MSTAMFAPYITVRGFVGSVCGGTPTFQATGVFIAPAIKGREDVEPIVNASLLAAKSFCQSNPVGVYA